MTPGHRNRTRDLCRTKPKVPVLFPRHTNRAARDNTINLIHMFRDYLHYHIKCSKAYIHSRMRAKASDFLKVLNRARPEPKVTEKKTITRNSQHNLKDKLSLSQKVSSGHESRLYSLGLKKMFATCSIQTISELQYYQVAAHWRGEDLGLLQFVLGVRSGSSDVVHMPCVQNIDLSEETLNTPGVASQSAGEDGLVQMRAGGRPTGQKVTLFTEVLLQGLDPPSGQLVKEGCLPLAPRATLDGATLDGTTLLSSETDWLEQTVVAGFRVWHIIFLSLASLLTLALDRVRAEIKSDTESVAQSEGMSAGSLSSGRGHPSPEGPQETTYRKASDIHIGISTEDLQPPKGVGARFNSVVESTWTKLRTKKQ
uniref:Arp2/3 complex 34 kDa subunit n=1 Tax=Timema tahoe TaxID=61484 RepID=A0A7R9IIP2_9NEOP|nr:unnamed protein product [Timema tahoe]